MENECATFLYLGKRESVSNRRSRVCLLAVCLICLSSVSFSGWYQFVWCPSLSLLQVWFLCLPVLSVCLLSAYTIWWTLCLFIYLSVCYHFVLFVCLLRVCLICLFPISLSNLSPVYLPGLFVLCVCVYILFFVPHKSCRIHFQENVRRIKLVVIDEHPSNSCQ